ncbi:MAG TPA: VTT domain-containing protein [Phycisphaerae bacterium]
MGLETCAACGTEIPRRARYCTTCGVTIESSTAIPKISRWHVHRRLYDWVLHWADTPHGSAALFLLAFAESSFFPVPPDVLLIALVLGARGKWLRYAGLCTLGSVLGGLCGYGIGYGLMESVGRAIIHFYHADEYYQTVNSWYQKYDFWIVFIAAFTPIPYKVFTIASGAFHMHLLGFTAVSIVGRGARFFAVATLLYWVGPPMRRFIERYFNLLSLAFVLLLIGGFVVIGYFR